MLQYEEVDPQVSLSSQFADTLEEPVIFFNLYHVEATDRDDFKLAWGADASSLTMQPGCLSTQLHQGLQGSSLLLQYAVFENTAAFAATQGPEFQYLRMVYPDSAISNPHLFRRVAVHNICVGEVKPNRNGGTRKKEPKNGLQHVELDPQAPLNSLFADTLDEAVILVNLFHVDAADHEDFKLAWGEDAAFFAKNHCISAQLHQGIQGSSMFLNYAVFENAAAFAATMQQPEFAPLRKIYPDSAIAHPHLFRRLTIPGICVGEIKNHADNAAHEFVQQRLAADAA
ncbi:MAG: antibiotic biosynthesis monooxygenase [Hymenobacter sp.]|nr:antibiotic biosynthesis monooxygenase [Hymenobacter sp.]